MTNTKNMLLGKTADGYAVFDRTNSHLHQEGGLTPELLAAAIGKVRTHRRPFVKWYSRFPEHVGTTTCVETTENDEIVMVYRKGRKGATPMVKNRKPMPCDTVTVILKKDQNRDRYILITAFIGSGCEKEPWDPSIRSQEEYDRCVEFWKTHALLYDESQIDRFEIRVRIDSWFGFDELHNANRFFVVECDGAAIYASYPMDEKGNPDLASGNCAECNAVSFPGSRNTEVVDGTIGLLKVLAEFGVQEVVIPVTESLIPHRSTLRSVLEGIIVPVYGLSCEMFRVRVNGDTKTVIDKLVEERGLQIDVMTWAIDGVEFVEMSEEEFSKMAKI